MYPDGKPVGAHPQRMVVLSTEADQPRSADHRTPDGGDHGWQQVWEENRRWVAAIILAHKPSWSDLDDLLQDVATTLVARGHEVRDRDALRPWLRTVAINAARLAGRRGKIRLTRSLDELGPDGSAPEPESLGTPEASDPAAQEDMSRVLELLGRLPDGYREPLILKAVEGLSYRQIGQILDLPETTVETRIARGRRMLRELSSQAGVGHSAE